MKYTIIETGRQFRDGRLSPATLTDDLLARIERENSNLNAYYEVFADEARAAARAAEKELRAGTDRGPLHGIPVAVKDLFDVAGHVTTCGAHPRFHPPPAEEDAAAVARLRAAGAVFLGKTAMHEYAMGVTNINPHFGATRNPHHPDRIAGGSSGGSAAALAAGLCVAALGSDTAGSIRIPAALCGVTGLKPTYGLVDGTGLFPLAKSLDHPGPMGNSVEDCFLLLEIMSDWRRGDAPEPRFMVPGNYFFDDIDPEVEKVVRAAVERLGEVTDIDAGDVEDFWKQNMTIIPAEASALHAERRAKHPERFGADLRARQEYGAGVTPEQLAHAREAQRDWKDCLDLVLEDDGVLVTPTVLVPAPPIEGAEGVAMVQSLTRLTSPFNLAGVPALSVPCGSARGLPVGLQLVANAGRESLLLKAGLLAESKA
ncbi:MAG: amidase [Planctomycetota bacterium]|jgi:aspartyl-tRNA(Asn)/glutamyl-tRNA(Gln) amidotransferase subunit A